MTKIHIVSHTHWDREWYRPFQYFRVKLVYLIDSILDILEKDADFQTYLLDGQTIVLDDYLQVKPQNRARLEKVIRSGRLRVGPWYIQPDEFAPDGESMIRNLQIGINCAEDFGGSMMIGYLPDSFGQTGQLPHLLRGFGIDSAVMMRGVPAYELQSSEFTWKGINGDEILGIYLPRGYSNAMFLPKDLLPLRARLWEVTRKLKKYAQTDNVLLMHGVDHQFPQAHIAGNIQRLNQSTRKNFYLHSTLEAYIAAVRDEKPELPELQGDLFAPHRNRAHSSIASTRIYQKQKNRRLEAQLEKYVEPISAMGWLLGANYPQELINQAWKILIQNQTHDGIGGCCTDEVHREMDQRFVEVEQICQTLQNTMSRAIARRISPRKLALTVFNNALTCGKQHVRAEIITRSENFILKDQDGEVIPWQLESVEEIDAAALSIWTLYMNTKQPAKRIIFSFETEFDFNLGYQFFEVLENKTPQTAENAIKQHENIFESQFYQLSFNNDGSFDLLDKQTGKTWNGLHIFEDCGDAGDTYNYSPVAHDRVITSRTAEAQIELIQNGPLKAVISIKLNLRVPYQLVDQDQQRSEELVDLPIESRITLYSQHQRIDIETTLNNTALDHRLRVLFPFDEKINCSHAETQFGTVQRPIELDTSLWREQKWSEKPLPIWPMQRFVEVRGSQDKLSVLNRGLPEYEIYQKESSTEKTSAIAITLLRGVGMMGKGNLLIRPGRPSGVAVPTPDAQCSGLRTLEYSLLPQSTEHPHSTPKAAAEYDAGALCVQSCIGLDKVMRKVGLLLKFAEVENLTSLVHDSLQSLGKKDLELIKLHDERLLISAVKKAEKEDALILRLYNSSEDTVREANLDVFFQYEEASLCDFNENDLELLPNHGDSYVLSEIRPFSAVTLKFKICKM